jgi:hypothetical protein
MLNCMVIMYYDARKLVRMEYLHTTGNILAVEHDLGGYDATHLACALIWQETLGMSLTLASFDSQLIEAARAVQMAYLPA